MTVSDGPQVRSVRTDGQRGRACSAGGAEGHEAAQEGGGAPQVGSDHLRHRFEVQDNEPVLVQ